MGLLAPLEQRAVGRPLDRRPVGDPQVARARPDPAVPAMELIPAIDLLGGRVVRLSRGAFDAVTDYGDDPVEAARRWAGEGAARIHVVDLDAARGGRSLQGHVVAAIVAGAGVRCQVAGGIRTAEQAAAALEGGADRVVLGSALISRPALGAELVARHGARHIVAALDVRGGEAVGDGWVAGARGRDVLAMAQTLADGGVRLFAVTSIARDGGLGGPDLELLDAIRGALPGATVIASGGVASLDDLRGLAAAGYEAAIVGRALYEGVFSLAEGIEAAR